MLEIDELQLNELLKCEKQIIEPPKKQMDLINRSYRNGFKAISIDKKYSFIVFIRQSEDIPDDFSIGLVYCSNTGKNITLYRCNGPHGDFVDNNQMENHYFGFHEHIFQPGSYNKMVGILTKAYGTFQDGLAYFCRHCNITNANVYFPFIGETNQLLLNFGNE